MNTMAHPAAPGAQAPGSGPPRATAAGAPPDGANDGTGAR
jgi:hypothetical protein